MKKTHYVSNNEFIELVKLHQLADECRNIAEHTADKSWKSRLEDVSKVVFGLFDERISFVSQDQLPTLQRKFDTSKIVLMSYDRRRIEKKKDETAIYELTISYDDLYSILDMALLTCYKCSQGERVEKCPFRKLLHRLSIPITREEVKPGECEFRADNEIKCVDPDYKQIVERGF